MKDGSSTFLRLKFVGPMTFCVLGTHPFGCWADAPAPKSANTAPVVTKIRLYPRSDFPAAATIIGAKFQGSNTSMTDGYVDLATITDKPAEKAWTEIKLDNKTPYRYLRFVAPYRTWQGIAEVEFDTDDNKITGVPFGSRGSYNNEGGTFDKAFDGDVNTVYNWPAWSAVAGIDALGKPGPPLAPTGLAAMSDDRRVFLSWLSSPGATSYTVKRAATARGPFALVGKVVTSDATVSYTDTKAENGQAYRYAVSAGNERGASPASEAVAATPATAAPGVTRICMIGDSITDGNNAPGGFRAPLYDKLTKAGYKFDFVGTLHSGPAGDADHEGHGGWEATQLAGVEAPPYWESQETPTGAGVWLPRTRPDIVLVMAGTNDMLHGKPAPQKRVASLVDKIHDVLPEARIIVAQVVMNGFTSTVEGLNGAIADMVKERAAKGWKIETVDMQHPLSYPADFADGVHPTSVGYAKMADVWFAALTPYLKK